MIDESKKLIFMNYPSTIEHLYGNETNVHLLVGPIVHLFHFKLERKQKVMSISFFVLNPFDQ